jgi:hypothetical protein
MEKEQVVSWLKNMLQDREWFHSIGSDQYGRTVVYVKYMDGEVLRTVPDWTEDGAQVLCHFASSITRNADDFLNKPQTNKLPTFDAKKFMQSVEEARAKGFDTGWVGAMGDEGREILEKLIKDREEKERLEDTPEQEAALELSVRALTDELDRLEKLCGSNILQDIFYEVHDQKNAVTNLSARYPEVRTRIQKLYDKYGFNAIYEELDG